MTLNAAYVSAVMADTPWGFWQMQETSGTSMADSSGGAHGGLYDSAVSSVSGPFSGWTAAHFATNAAWVSGVYATNSPMSFEMWALLDPPGNNQCVAIDYSNAANTQGFEYFTGQTAGSGPNAAFSTLDPSMAWVWSAHPMFSSSGWQYTVLQFEADGHWRCYMRNAAFSLVTDDLGAHSLNLASSPNLYLGRRPSGTFPFKGAMCAVAFYTHTLTTAQMDAHYNAAAGVPPPPPCPYGTRVKAGTPSLVEVTDTFLLSLVAIFGDNGWRQFFGNLIGTRITTADVCASLPPTLPPFEWQDLLTVGWRGITQLQIMAWWQLCECVPGSGTVLPPPAPTPVVETGTPPEITYVVNPTNPCLDLVEVRRKLDELLRITQADLSTDTLMQRYMLPLVVLPGAVHTGLTGAGSIVINRIVGVQIVVTANLPDRTLEGAPLYVWDIGWVSIMDDNGFIQERRITREVEVWMPSHCAEATTLGYSLKGAVQVRITELLPAT